MKLFGRRAGREGSRPALSRGALSAIAAGPPSYEAQVREAYGRNAVAQRAVRLVAEAVGSAPLDGTDAALTALAAARVGGVRVLEAAATHLLLHGNAFLQVLRGAEGEVAALYPLRPERVSVEADTGGWPAAYLYRVGAGVTRLDAGPFRPGVVHLKLFHPLDGHYGLGALPAAAGAVAAHNAAAAWNTALLDNAARPSGALIYEPGDGTPLSPEQFGRLSAEMEAGFTGAARAGRPMLLEGGLRWQPLGLSPAEMDFAGLKAAAAREIALAFGVPPMLLGLPGDATYANYKEANKALWRLAVLPLAHLVLDGLAQALDGWFPGARLEIDLNRVPALAEDREALWSAIAPVDFLSADEKRAMLGIGGPA